MKKYFAIISLLLASVVSINAMGDDPKDTETKLIDLKKDNIDANSRFDRSIDFSVIEACAYTELGVVAVTLHNIGDATVRLIDSNNQIVCSDYTQTDTPVVIYLDAHSTTGTYYIEVISPSWYAEGEVVF